MQYWIRYRLSSVKSTDAANPVVRPGFDKAHQVAALLIDIEAHLRQLNLWQAESPSASALASTEPFCLDTLNFDQWLQFVFLPTLYAMLEARQPLPSACAIAPMAEEILPRLGLPSGPLLASLAEIDRVLTDDSGAEVDKP